MKVTDNLFTVKLQELVGNYHDLEVKIKASQDLSPSELHQMLHELCQLYCEQTTYLEEKARNSRSVVAAALSEIQNEYCRQSEMILYRCLHQTETEQQLEKTALLAEYAMDFANEAIQYALITSLYAIDLQKQFEQEGR